jgi:hypothetical protein
LRALPIVAAVASFALAAAGCVGSDEDAAFKKDFKPINAQIVALGSEVGQTLQNASRSNDREVGRKFLGFVPRLQAIKRRVDALDPPADLKPQVKRLSAAASRLIVDLGGIALAARSHGKRAYQTAVDALFRDSPAIANARRAIAKATGIPANP